MNETRLTADDVLSYDAIQYCLQESERRAVDYIVKERERKTKVDGICLGLLSLSAIELLCSALWLRELNNSNKCDQCCCTIQGSRPSETRIVFFALDILNSRITHETTKKKTRQASHNSDNELTLK